MCLCIHVCSSTCVLCLHVNVRVVIYDNRRLQLPNQLGTGRAKAGYGELCHFAPEKSLSPVVINTDMLSS